MFEKFETLIFYILKIEVEDRMLILTPPNQNDLISGALNQAQTKIRKMFG
jgi:hypothetical protein